MYYKSNDYNTQVKYSNKNNESFRNNSLNSYSCSSIIKINNKLKIQRKDYMVLLLHPRARDLA